jgi:AraC-like DNA-binding protein
MRFVSRPPCPALAPFVHSFWHFESAFAPGRERILPSGKMQLLVNLEEDQVRSWHGEGFATLARSSGAVLSGAGSRCFAIDTAEQRAIVGISFHPGGAAPFFSIPAHALAESSVTLDEVWGREGAVVRERVLEARSPAAKLAVLERILIERCRTFAPNRAILHAAAALERGARIGAVTSELGMTPRRFIARFSEIIGLPPKLYARVRRFQRVLEALEAGRAHGWAQIAAFSGYFDQSHLIRDFAEFSGLAPSAYKPGGSGGRNHVPL